jgi:hypothetical protein
MITSEYWLDRSDLIASEYEGEVMEEEYLKPLNKID